ncbi:MAG: hypothetical protein VX554_00115 [Candidatus Thermoplasmatota archaeon]|nr:hypothetical protein [Candidatus Thermoplasmatota archaeon]
MKYSQGIDCLPVIQFRERLLEQRGDLFPGAGYRKRHLKELGAEEREEVMRQIALGLET